MLAAELGNLSLNLSTQWEENSSCLLTSTSMLWYICSQVHTRTQRRGAGGGRERIKNKGFWWGGACEM